MPFDEFVDIETIQKERRAAVHQSLREIALEELRKVAKEHQDEFVGDPWRDKLLHLMEEQPQATFYTAVPQKDVVVYYCRDADFGVWVLVGSGMGPLDANGKRLMKEAIEGPASGRNFGK